MENSDKAKIIIEVLKRELERSATDHIRATAESAKAQVGSELWEKESDDLGFSRNPYNIEIAQKKVQTTLEQRLFRQEVLDYAIDIFISKI